MIKKFIVCSAVILIMLISGLVYFNSVAKSAGLTLKETIELYAYKDYPPEIPFLPDPDLPKSAELPKLDFMGNNERAVAAFILSTRREFLKDNDELKIFVNFLKNFKQVAIIKLLNTEHSKEIIIMALFDKENPDIIYDGKKMTFNNSHTKAIITSVKLQPFMIFQPEPLQKTFIPKGFQLPMDDSRLDWFSIVSVDELLWWCQDLQS